MVFSDITKELEFTHGKEVPFHQANPDDYKYNFVVAQPGSGKLEPTAYIYA